jgi:hypothetical protein
MNFPQKPSKYRMYDTIWLVRLAPGDDQFVVRFEKLKTSVIGIRLRSDRESDTFIYRLANAESIGWVEERCVLESEHVAMMAIQKYSQSVRETGVDKPDRFKERFVR